MDVKISADISRIGEKSLDLVISVRPSLAATHVVKVEILTPLVNFGAKILHNAQLNLPVDAKSSVTWRNPIGGRMNLTLPKESTRLAQFSTRPAAFLRLWPKETRAYIQCEEKTIYVEQLENKVHRIKQSFFENETGVKINVDGHYHGHIFQKGINGLPSALLIGENNFEVGAS